MADLNITGTGYTPQISNKKSSNNQKQSKNNRPQSGLAQSRADIQIAQHKDYSQGLNIGQKQSLEVVGKSKASNKLKFTPTEKKISSDFKSNDNNQEMNDEEIMDIYKLDDFSNNIDFNEGNYENYHLQSKEDRERDLNYNIDDHTDIRKNVVLSGGFKIPTESLEKRAERIKNMYKKKVEPVSATEEEKTKRKILQQMGVVDQDMDEYFDIMDERVYEKEQDDQVHSLLEGQVENKISGVHSQREQLIRKKAELERQKQEILQAKQAKLDRLYGQKKKINFEEYIASIQEQDQEESGQLPPEFNESLDNKQRQKQNNLISDLDKNVQPYERNKWSQHEDVQQQNQQPYSQATTNDYNQEGIQENFDADYDQQYDQDEEIQEQPYDDKQIDNFINRERPDFQSTEDKLEIHRQQMKELEYQYYNRKQIQDKKDEEQLIIQQKIERGIMRASVPQAQQEQSQYELEFKQFVRERKKKDEMQKMQSVGEKKAFELFQSTSPNPVNWKKPTQAPMRENISSLYPLDVQNQLKKQAREGGQFDNLNDIGLAQSGFMNTVQNNSTKKNNKAVISNSSGMQKQENKDSEMLLLQALFDKLDKSQRGYIDKNDFGRELLQNQELREMYNLNKETFNKELQNFKTSKKNQLNPAEMVKFLKKERISQDKVKNNNYFVDEIRKNKQTQNSQEEKSVLGNCLLTKEHLQIMKQVFDKVDKDQDWVIKRSKLIEGLREDVRIARILHLPAVFLAAIDKQLTVDRVLYRIEKEEFIGDQNERKNKEFITWTQYLEYFTDSLNINKKPKKQQEEDLTKSKQIKLYTQIKNQMDDQDLIDIGDNVKQMIQDSFDKTEKQSDIYVNTTFFIQNVKLNNQYANLQNQQARLKASDFDLPEELIFQVFERMEEEADEFIEFDEIMDFFTRRGRPKSQKNQQQKKQGFGSATGVPSLSRNEGGFLNKSSRNKSRSRSKDRKKYSKNNNNKYQENESQGSGSFNRSKYDNDQDDSDDEEDNINEYIDAYDSDPETYQYIKGQQPYKPNPKQSKFNRSISSQNFNKSLAVSQYQDIDEQSRFKQSKVGFSTVQINRQQSKNISDSPNQQYNEQDLNNQRSDFKQYGQHDKNDNEFSLTKPHPFKFDEREKQQKKTRSISQRKFDEMIEQKQQEHYETHNKPFKANKVPGHVNQELYKELMHSQEKRRADVRANSIAITISREKPFSFYKRDIENMKAKKKNKYERENFVFKANKVPWFCSVRLLDRINNEEQLKRQERVAKEAQKIMQMSKLPPRMEMHEQQRQAQLLRDGVGTVDNIQQQQSNNNNTRAQQELVFQPPKAKPIPDFDRLQKGFQESLDRRRQSKRPTQPKPFNFQETRKAPPRDYLDRENELMKHEKEKPKVDKIQEARKVANQEPLYMPPSTKKFETYVQMQKKIKEEKQKKIEEEEKKKKLKEEKTKKFAQKFRNSATIKNDEEKKKKRQ